MQVDSYPVNYVNKIPSMKGKRTGHSTGTTIQKNPKKRTRRTAAEIERKHKCTYQGCRKSYGSEGALKMHIKLKHSPDKSNAYNSKYTRMNPDGSTVSHGLYPIPLVPKRLLPSLPFGTLRQFPVNPPNSCWMYELPDPTAGVPMDPLEFPSEPPAEELADTVDLPVISSPSQGSVGEIEDLHDMEQFQPQLVSHDGFGGFPCGSIYFSLTNSPGASRPALFSLSNIRIGNWSQLAYSAVDLSLQVNHEKNMLVYYIEDCTLPLDSMEMSTSLKIEFHIDSVSEYFLESDSDCVLLVLSLQFSPCFYSCSVPRGHIFDTDAIQWSPTKDFTRNNATEHRFHILKVIKGDERTESRLKSLFTSSKIKLNSQVAVELDDGNVFQMKNQIPKYESLLLDQRFSRMANSFRGDQPLFRVHGVPKPNKKGIQLPALPNFQQPPPPEPGNSSPAEDLPTFEHLDLEQLFTTPDDDFIRQLNSPADDDHIPQ